MDFSDVQPFKQHPDAKLVFFHAAVLSGKLRVLSLREDTQSEKPITSKKCFPFHRYSGKTQKQIIEFVRDNYVKRQTFQR